MDVTNLALTLLIDVFTVLADPIGIAHSGVFFDGLDHDAARVLQAGRVVERQLDFLPGAIGEAL